jgi:hypothetical protein
VSATVNAGVPAIGPIAEVVIATNQLDADRAACERILGWRADRGEPVPAEAAARWGAPAVTGASSVTVGPVAAAPGAGVRLVESAAPAAHVPLTTFGWAAAEVIVADVDAVARAVDAADVEVLGRPAAVGGTGGGARAGLRAMQIVLPGGAPLYLTEIGAAPPGFELPRIRDGVGGVFIVVVASPNLEQTREFFEARFVVRRITDHPLSVGVLNRAFQLEPATRHRVSTLQLSGEAAIEIDQYPAKATTRPHRAGELAPGIAAVEFYAADTSPVEHGPVNAPFGLRLAVVAASRNQ